MCEALSNTKDTEFKSLYKFQSKKYDSQEIRRQKLLEDQKLKRSLCQDKFRNLEQSVKVPSFQNNYGRKFRRWTFQSKYKTDQKLQFSEWLHEKPENLSEWYLVPCPKGDRCMVVACNGRTEMYEKTGRYIKGFPSLLPGDAGGSKNDITILDCIYVRSLATFYVLDAISFGNLELTNCEAEFRFFWLKSKLLENNLVEVSSKNNHSFVGLNFYDFESTSKIFECLQSFPLWPENQPELDGLLFYHKEANYTFGQTPLVGWLFPFMVPEVLNLCVDINYEKPPDYIDYKQYIYDFDRRMEEKRNRNRIKKGVRDENEMETLSDDESSSLRAAINSQIELEMETSIVEDERENF